MNRILLLFTAVFLLSIGSYGQSQTFNTSGTFIVPAGVTSITVQCWGAGGAGGGAVGTGTNYMAGGGGGGGGYSTTTITVVPAESINYVVGTGGSGSTGSGGNGGNTSFKSVSANGGTGGAQGNSSDTTGAGGTGGTGATNNGSDGAAGTLPWYGVSLGGDGGNGGNGGSGGSGGSGFWFFGANNNNGDNGTVPGGGGGGGGRYNNNVSGGNGANGRVRVAWTCPTYALTAAASASSICVSGSSTVTLTSTSLPDGTYTVTYGTTNPVTSGNTATMSFSGITGTFTTISLSANSNITVTNLSSGTAPSICSNPISSNHVATVTVNPLPTVTSSAGSSKIYTGTTNLTTVSATASTGATIDWYDAGGVLLLANSLTYAPTGINVGTYTVFAEAKNGGCVSSSRTPVALTINKAAITITANAQSKCYGTILNLGTTAFTTSALQNGETITSVTLASAGGYDASTTQPAGLYASDIIPSIPIGANGFIASNYAITFVAGNITINALPNNILSSGFSATTTCAGGSPQLTFDAEDATFTGSYSITYKNNANATLHTETISTASATSFSPFDNPTANAGYTLISISNLTCTRTTLFGDDGADLYVRPIPSIGISSSAASVCKGDSSPNVIFTNTHTVSKTVTYTINGGSDLTVNIGANSTTPVSVSTASNGSFVYSVKSVAYQDTPGCSNTITPAGSITETVTVREDSGDISLNGVSHVSNTTTTYCALSTAVFSIATVSGAASYAWTVPSGWTIVSGQGTTTITAATGTSAESGTVYVLANNLFCPSYLGVTLSSIAPGAPAVTAIQPTCATPKGTITVTGPVSGTSYTVTGTNPVVAGVTNATGIFPNLDAGDYVVTSQIGSGCVSTPTATISLAALVTKTWTGIWSPAGAPDINNHVVFDADYTISSSINACSCTVNSTADVTIASGKFLNIVHDLDVQGTLEFMNGASLIQEDENAVNTGVIKYNRTTSPLKKFDYVYWSSPVEGETLDVFSPDSDRFYSRIGDDWSQRVPADVMEAGYGYIARVPRDTNPQSVTFEGKPNNGKIIVAVTSANDNLVGNPYPSSINADEFIDVNKSLIKGMLSFWTHITKRKLNSAGNLYEYTVDDFAYYNSSGWVSPVSDEDLILQEAEGTIGAGQSFFVHSTAGNFKFTNEMRIAEEDKNGLFFKQANKKKRAKIEKNRVWLNLTNSDGAFRQLLVGYITGATNDLDNLYDGTTNGGNAVIDFYSIMNTNRFMIQGRGLPFDETDEVPLGYKSAIDGLFEISIAKRDGALASQAVYLEDKTANVVHDLTKGSYSFTTAKGEFTDRFVMRYTAKSTLGTGDFDAKGNGVIVSVKNSQIKVNSFDQTMQSVKVYDLKGSLAYQKDKINTNEFVIDQLNSSNQFMIVMVQLEDGKWVSEEIIFHD